MSADEENIRKLVADWMAATKSGNVDAILKMMSDDVVFLTPGNAPMRKSDFAAAARAQTGAELEIDGKSDIQEIQICGEWAFMWSSLSVTVKSPDSSSPTERSGHTLTVFRKEGEQWLLARDANMLSTKPAATT